MKLTKLNASKGINSVRFLRWINAAANVSIVVFVGLLSWREFSRLRDGAGIPNASSYIGKKYEINLKTAI